MLPVQLNRSDRFSKFFMDPHSFIAAHDPQVFATAQTAAQGGAAAMETAATRQLREELSAAETMLAGQQVAAARFGCDRRAKWAR